MRYSSIYGYCNLLFDNSEAAIRYSTIHGYRNLIFDNSEAAHGATSTVWYKFMQSVGGHLLNLS
jgi:hypothetical protein